MSGRHPSPEVRAAFVAGLLSEAECVAIAVHLDDCAPCRQLILAEDDLHAALVDEGEALAPPRDLIPAILADQRTPGPGPVPAISLALLGAAALLLAVLGEPAQLFAEGAAWGRGIATMATVFSQPAAFGLWPALPGALVVAGVVLVLVRMRKDSL